MVLVFFDVLHSETLALLTIIVFLWFSDSFLSRESFPESLQKSLVGSLLENLLWNPAAAPQELLERALWGISFENP